jgi:flavin reductase (DIM6/NTAB) family NADH-FMN oxidoreductase RutF
MRISASISGWLYVSGIGSATNINKSEMQVSAPIDLFRRLTTGVYVIGVAHEGHNNAFTAAWVTQVSFEPLLVALAVNTQNLSYSLLKQSGAFVLNMLRRDQLDLARHFGTQSGRELDKFVGQRWRPGTLGAPILQNAAAYLECRISGAVAAGDHELVLGRAIRGEVIDDTAEVMLYAQTDDLDGSSQLYPASFEKDT